jgi:hypothetical protein
METALITELLEILGVERKDFVTVLTGRVKVNMRIITDLPGIWTAVKQLERGELL